MPFEIKNYEEIVQNILDDISQNVTRESIRFERSKVEYLLKCPEEPVNKLLKVEGLLKGERHVFKGDLDYVLREDRIEWVSINSSSKKPDDLSDFFVTYSYGNLPSTLTDINVGSVLRTLVESIARELELLYSELRYVYDSGFIDTAKGKSLDLVVSILGIKRKAPTFANGYITFIKESDPPEVTTNEILIYDGRELYELKNAPVKTVTKVRINEEGQERILVDGDDYHLENNSLVWSKGPKVGTEFYVDYISYQRINVPRGTTISTFSKQSGDVVSFVTMHEAQMTLNDSGYWEANVEATAKIAGSKGNVLAGSVIVMPRPPLGVDKVINRSVMGGGSDEEHDDALRERAKKIMDVKGKATIESLRTALEGVDGIQSAPLIIDMPDDIPGVVKAIVDGGDEAEIRKVIEDTRAAGIVVEFERPKLVVLDIEITVIVQKGTTSSQRAKLVSLAEKNVREYLSNLRIGDSIMVNRIVAILLEINLVRDMEDILITAYRLPPQVERLSDREKKITAGLDVPSELGDEGEIDGSKERKVERLESKEMTKSVSRSRENVEISPNERGYARDIKISIKEESR